MESNPAYGVSDIVENRQISTDDDNLYELDLPAIDKTIIENRRISGDGSLYEFVDLSATGKRNNKGVTGSAQGELKNANSSKVSLIIGIALSTAVLALVVAMVSVGVSTALNSNSEIQSLLREVEKLQLSLNASVNTIEELDSKISALQTNTSTQYGILNETVNSIQNTIREQSDLQNILQQQVASQTQLTSCSEIPTDRPSGEYWILGNSSSVRVYCDMNRTCCNTTGGWMTVAHLDMTDSNQQCPDGFLLHNENTAPLRTCGRPGPAGCISTTFPVHGIGYSRVCGRVIGYQFATTNAFQPYFNNRSLTLNDYYLDGISLTHGQSPRRHIWTFAAAAYELTTVSSNICPCTRTNINYTGIVPPFIGQDYFCDTGGTDGFQSTLYHDDPLWNAQGCGGRSTCCSFNNPPWFCKQLPQPTTDDIELRLCADQATSNEDVLIELVDIFVQ